MAKCCQTNNCVEIEPSGCVKYTGTPTANGLIDKQDYCDPYLNDIIKLFDDNLTSLDVRVGIDKIALDAVNNSCGITPVINTTTITVKDEKYYSSQVVLKLLEVVCELRSRLNYLTAKNTDTNLGNLHWEDMPLSAGFIAWLNSINPETGVSYAQCLGNNVCDPNSDLLTLGDLLKAIINKLCDCCTIQ
jgi:hypothetical protein